MLRGQPVAGVNVYQRWPAYVEGKHMPFRDWQEWNQKCERKNEEYGAFLVKQ